MTRFELFRRSLWLMVRRFPADPSARRVVLVLVGILAYVLCYGLLLRKQYQDSGPWGIGGSAILGLLGLGVAFFIRRRNAHGEDSLLKLSAHAEPEPRSLSQHRERLAQWLLRTASMVDRAGGETLHRLGRIGAERTGVCRRRTLDAAHYGSLWETYSAEEQTLLMAPEGSWETDEVWPRVLEAEDVRVLRWVLGIDQVLVPFEFLTPELAVAVEITSNPTLVQGETCLESYDLRPAQTISEGMVGRCLAEMVRRGSFEMDDDPAKPEYLGLAERMHAEPGVDLLIGVQTVGHADDEKVRWIAQAAMRRARVLASVIDYLNGDAQAGPILAPGL